MNRREFGRRAALGLLLAPLGAGIAPASAQSIDAGAGASIRFRRVVADASPLLRFGGAGSVRILEPPLTAQLRNVFADRLAPGDARAPDLVARITHFYMTSYAGGEPVDAIGPQDSIEGDGLVVSGGRQLSSTHVLTSLRPSFSGAFYTQGIDQRRADSIAYQFAYWLRREMNV